MPAHRVVILGAGKGARGSLPSAIVPVDCHSRVLDWLLAAFSVLESPEVFFVGGYMADAVIEQYPDIHFVFNPAWQETGPVKSLSVAPLAAERATYISYSDVVFRPARSRPDRAAETGEPSPKETPLESAAPSTPPSDGLQRLNAQHGVDHAPARRRSPPRQVAEDGFRGTCARSVTVVCGGGACIAQPTSRRSRCPV